MPRVLTAVLIGLIGLTAAAAHAQVIDPDFPGLVQRDRSVPFTDINFDDDLFPINVNNWWGHMNQRGRVVVYPAYDWTDYSYDNFARVVVDGRTGFLFADEHLLVEPIYPYADRFSGGYAVVGDGERFGYLDRAAKLRVPIRLDGALRFSDSLAAVQVGDRVGFINTRGDVAIPLRFAGARSFHNGLAAVQLPPPPPPPEEGRREQTPSELAAGPFGFIDKTGTLVYLDRERRITDLGDFHDNMARARIGTQWGYLDRRFKLRIPARYDDARDFHDGLAAVRVGDRWGYIDRDGRFVVAPRFDSAGDFGQTLALVEVEGLFGYINRAGEMAIVPQFEAADPFFRKYARVSQAPNFGYVGVGGNVIWDPRDVLSGLRDRRAEEFGRIASGRLPRSNRTISLPPPRDPAPTPYPRDDVYEYVAELPWPAELEPRMNADEE